MPKMSVRPTERRKSRTPYDSPFRAWPKKSGTNTTATSRTAAALPGRFPAARGGIGGPSDGPPSPSSRQGAAGAGIGDVGDLVDRHVVEAARHFLHLAHVDERLDDVVRLREEAGPGELDRLLQSKVVVLLHEVHGVGPRKEGVHGLGARLLDLGEVRRVVRLAELRVIFTDQLATGRHERLLERAELIFPRLIVGRGDEDFFGDVIGHPAAHRLRSEEHTSELQSLAYLVC